MFLAALIILTNSFFNVYENPENDSIAQTAIYLHQHFAEADLLAARYLHILKSFQKTVADHRSMNDVTCSASKEFVLRDPIEDLFSDKAHSSQRQGHSQNDNSLVSSNLAAEESSSSVRLPVSWDWPSTSNTRSIPANSGTAPSESTLNNPFTTVGFDYTSMANGVSNNYGNGASVDNVEGLVFPGANELLGPDLGPVLEDVIHFDMLWPLDQDTGLYSGNIPMYGTDSYF